MSTVNVENRFSRRTVRGRRSMEDPSGPQHVWWLREALAQEERVDFPALDHNVSADVCIVGGGFTGLWAAIDLLEQDPSLSVVLIEKDECGFGASGRNGGWATGWHDEIGEMTRRFGSEEALRLVERSAWALNRIQAFSEEHEIDARFRKGGVLWGSSAKWQQGMWQGPTEIFGGADDSDQWIELSAEEIQAKTGSPLLLNGAWQREGASVQPALLVRGLRRVAARLGVKIFEHTELLSMTRGRPTKLSTPLGDVEAGVVILATGAWSAKWPELRRSFVPIASHIVATEPIPDRIGALEWSRGAVLGDGNKMVHYAQVSTDGRIIFGRGGGSIGAFGHVGDRHFDNPRAISELIGDFHRWFPQLDDVKFEFGWGGAVDRSPGHLPFVGRFDCEGEILFGAGYSGNGVGPSAYIGRILGHAALGMRDADTTGAMAGGVSASFPPEPARAIGGSLVRGIIHWAEGGEKPGSNSLWLHESLGRAVTVTAPARKKTGPALRV